MANSEKQDEKKPETIEFEDIDISRPDILEQPVNRFRRCPIIVTLADPQITPVDIQQMLECGINIVKFKMSYSSKGDKLRMIGKLDKAADACCRKFGISEWPIATCVELKTIVVKTGLLENNADQVKITKGSVVKITCNMDEYNRCNDHNIFIDNPYLESDIPIGTEISIASDEIILHCIEKIDFENINCIVIKGGILKNVCNFCARGISPTRPNITKKDLEIVNFALAYQIDMIVVNYVRNAETIKEIKKHIGNKIAKPLIFCGLCTGEDLENADEIIKECDGVIFARDFLPYETSASLKLRLPQIQKWISSKCLQAGKPMYLSGGVFKEAICTGVFHINEISDVVNAIMDGVSGFVLQDCFDVDLALQVLRALNELCYFVEPLVTSKINFWRILDEVKMPINAAEAAVISCAMVANLSKARVIVIPTVSGKTMKALHWMRPSALIITVSTKLSIIRLLHTYRVNQEKPFKDWYEAIEDRVKYAIEYAVQRGWLQYRDYYVTLQRGADNSSFCDMVRVWEVSISKKHLVEC
ncbi:pyruvate kinase-like isoform X2 [Leptidea sinapis]|uniref:pyruvate kinase-like isoform X2 n=1 Tax=Leptidea sinapis TaxID=189913 RepID=UPI0021C29A6C|nr:pyruvate kinase-like isoform X2 [Leptidea sinapis]